MARSTFVTASLTFLFGLACLIGTTSADTTPSFPGTRPEAFLADPASLIYDRGASIVMIGIGDAQQCAPSETDETACSSGVIEVPSVDIDTDGDGIFDASSAPQRQTGELDCSDPRATSCRECLGSSDRVCCPSEMCTVSNCPKGAGYCPNDKGSGSHCCKI